MYGIEPLFVGSHELIAPHFTDPEDWVNLGLVDTTRDWTWAVWLSKFESKVFDLSGKAWLSPPAAADNQVIAFLLNSVYFLFKLTSAW